MRILHFFITDTSWSQYVRMKYFYCISTEESQLSKSIGSTIALNVVAKLSQSSSRESPSEV